RAHVRYFSLPVTERSPIRALVLESYKNGMAPTTLAITADTAAPKPRRVASCGASVGTGIALTTLWSRRDYSRPARKPRCPSAVMTLWTIGHSTRTQEEFVAALQSQQIMALADVRKLPGSRRYPHFDQEPLAIALRNEGIE